MGRLWLLCWLPACVWIADDSRLDRDGDGFPGVADCNDDEPEVSVLEATSGDLVCGQDIEATLIPKGGDTLSIINCTYPEDPTRLVDLGNTQDIYRFQSLEPVAVQVVLDATEFAYAFKEEEPPFVALVANRGNRCEVDACEVGLPTSVFYAPSKRGSWIPTVEFTAAPGEPWHIVVAGEGTLGDPAAYTVTVLCDPEP